MVDYIWFGVLPELIFAWAIISAVAIALSCFFTSRDLQNKKIDKENRE